MRTHSRLLGALGAVLWGCGPAAPPARPQAQVLVPRQAVPAGAPLGPELFEPRLVDAALAGPGALRPGAPELAPGATAAVALTAGQVVPGGAVRPPPDASRGEAPRKLRALDIEVPLADAVRPGDFVDLTATITDPLSKEAMVITLMQAVRVEAAAPGSTPALRRLTLLVLPEEAEVVVTALHLGSLEVAVRNPGDPDVQEERGRSTLTTLLTGERISTLLKKRQNTIQVIKGTGEAKGEAAPTPPASARPVPGAGARDAEAGQLTAGEWDDDVNLARFQAYLASYRRDHAGVPILPSGDRAEIKVENEAGQPLPDARVQVRSGGKLLLDARTAADGRLLYFPRVDGPAEGSLTVRVEAPGGPAAAEETGSASQRSWRVVVAGARPEASAALDLAFVLDTTGSMGDELAYLQREVDWIAREVARTNPGVEARFALVVYKDRRSGDPYVVRGYDFSDLATFRARLDAQRAGGGGDYPEAMEEAAGVLNRLSWREGHTTRLAFLVADAPPHDDKLGAYYEQVKAARLKGVHVYPVAASGARDDVEFVLRQTAQLTQARYLWLTDDSGIGNSHAEPHLPCYRVQRLNAMIARMVREELTGARVVPEPAQVVRTVGHPAGGTCTD